jgi:hypothetical protein
MPSYSSFKKISSEAIVDLTIQSGDIANTTIVTGDIQDGAVVAGDMSGVVTSPKLNATIDLSGKTVTYRAIVNSDISASAGIVGAKLAAGAATTNIGFTPVNTGGDTMTGAIIVPAGSASAPSITRDGNTNTGISLESGAIRITGGGSEAIVIDNSGRVRRPNHPAFAVSATAGWLYASNYGGTGDRELNSGPVGWNNAAHQTGGSNWNPSSGRYTAPVAGYYVFHTCWYMLNDNNSTPSYIHAYIKRNSSEGTLPGGRTPQTINMHGNRNNYDDGSNYSNVFTMNAGDYASVFVRWHSYNSRHHAGHHIFSGHLIG